MNKKQSLENAIREAEEFIRRGNVLLNDDEYYWMYKNTADRGALNRQSMELTRALAAFRKTGAIYESHNLKQRISANHDQQRALRYGMPCSRLVWRNAAGRVS